MSSYQERLRTAIAPYQPTVRDDLLAWRRSMYGDDAAVATSEYFDWLFAKGPGAIEHGPALWIYAKDGRIEGQQGAVRVVLKIGNRLHRAAWTLDLMVSPAMRVRGVGAVLAELAQTKVGISLGLDVSHDARKAYLRQGWLDIGIVPLWVRPISRRALERRVGRRVAPLAVIALRVLEMIGSLSGAHLELARVDGWFDDLWSRVKHHYPLVIRRDAAFLRWRYEDFPNPDRYAIHRVMRGTNTIGWVVLRVDRKDNLPTGYVVDFLCAPRHAYFVFAAVLSHFRSIGVERVQCLHTGLVGRASLHALGFVPISSGWRFMMRPSELDDEERTLVSEMRSWFITAGDADVDRPRDGTLFAQ